MKDDIEIPAWQRLGFERHEMEGVARNMSASFDWWHGPPTSPDDVVTWASDASREGMAVFAMRSLGYTSFAPPLDDWCEVGRRLVAAMVHYFFGAWRDRFRLFGVEYDRRKARAELPWSSEYRDGLTVAVSLGDWASAEELLRWPGPDLRVDEGMDDRTPEDNAYQIWLAARLRGEPAADGATQRSLVQRGSRLRPKMLLDAADALLAGDASRLAATLERYVRHYRKKELRLNRVDFGICADANVLWHLARRRGLGEVTLPPDVGMFMAKP